MTLYILGFVVYTIIVGSIVRIVKNVTGVNKKIIEQFPELASKPEGGGGGGGEDEGEGGDENNN